MTRYRPRHYRVVGIDHVLKTVFLENDHGERFQAPDAYRNGVKPGDVLTSFEPMEPESSPKESIPHE